MKGNNTARTIARQVLPTHFYQNLARWWHYLGNIGLKHKCPICGKHVRAFLSFGLRPRPNARCPFCSSLERHRSTWLFLRNRSHLFYKALTLLHVAPAPALRRKLSRLPNVHYVTADLDPSRAMVSMDIQFIPFQDGSFDCILCSHVLEHVTDDQRAMGEFFRILKPGGWAILQVPLDSRRDETYEDRNITSPDERERVFGQRDHVRIYGQDYATRLANTGFIVQFDSYVQELEPDVVSRYGLSTQDIFLVRKAAEA